MTHKPANIPILNENIPEESSKTNSNPTTTTTNTTMPFNLEHAIKILKKFPIERTGKELDILSQYLSSNKFFQSALQTHGYFTYRQLICQLRYDYKEEGKVIFNAGDTGNNFYIVLQGSVSIKIELRQTVNNETSQGRKQYVLQEIGQIGPGSSFGELALLNDKPRNATCIARRDCHLAMLSKGDYKCILAQEDMKKVSSKMDDIASFPIFHDAGKATLSTLIYHFKLNDYTQRNVIYREGDESDYAYFIKSGEFKVTKNLDINVEFDDHLQQMKDKIIFRKTITKTVELAVCGAWEIVGLEDVMAERKRESTLTCVSLHGSAYVIHKEDLKKRLYGAANEAFLNITNRYCKSHEEWYRKRLDELQEATKNNRQLLMSFQTKSLLKRTKLNNSESKVKQSSKKSLIKSVRNDRIPSPSIYELKETKDYLDEYIHLTEFNHHGNNHNHNHNHDLSGILKNSPRRPHTHHELLRPSSTNKRARFLLEPPNLTLNQSFERKSPQKKGFHYSDKDIRMSDDQSRMKHSTTPDIYISNHYMKNFSKNYQTNNLSHSLIQDPSITQLNIQNQSMISIGNSRELNKRKNTLGRSDENMITFNSVAGLHETKNTIHSNNLNHDNSFLLTEVEISDLPNQKKFQIESSNPAPHDQIIEGDYQKIEDKEKKSYFSSHGRSSSCNESMEATFNFIERRSNIIQKLGWKSKKHWDLIKFNLDRDKKRLQYNRIIYPTNVTTKKDDYEIGKLFSTNNIEKSNKGDVAGAGQNNKNNLQQKKVKIEIRPRTASEQMMYNLKPRLPESILDLNKMPIKANMFKNTRLSIEKRFKEDKELLRMAARLFSSRLKLQPPSSSTEHIPKEKLMKRSVANLLTKMKRSNTIKYSTDNTPIKCR